MQLDESVLGKEHIFNVSFYRLLNELLLQWKEFTSTTLTKYSNLASPKNGIN